MIKETLTALLIDDDPEFAEDFGLLLPPTIKCRVAASVPEADRYLADHEVDVVFLDIDLGRGDDGLRYLETIKETNPYLPVIMISADRGIETVVRAMQMGASDYVGKSPHLDELKISINRAIEVNRFRRQYDLLESELNRLTGRMIGQSDAMAFIKRKIKRLAAVASNVLITGASGTGKELAARSLHRLSPRSEGPFLAINCPALSRELIESELFGHEKGAFTGAETRRIGKFEQVGEGTLFLDEITEIPPDVQAKLLRVLQEREFERVGGNRLIPFNGRILASTNRDPEEAVSDGSLRNDLYYRLMVTHLHIPPLADRRDDIPLLVEYFVRVKSLEMKKKPPRVSREAMQQLCAYDWPGNVRELGNCIENAIVHCDSDTLEVADLSRCTMNGAFSGTYEEAKKKFLADFQRHFIKAAIKRNDGNLSRTAEGIGVTRQGLAKMMKACGLD